MRSINVRLVNGGRLPQYKSYGASGADCYANIKDALPLPPQTRVQIPLGFCLELDEGYEAQIRPRSGLSKIGIDVKFGTIDWDYRGELCANVYNETFEPFVIEPGMRICQLVIQRVEQYVFNPTNELSETERGANGFGSTGV